MRSVSRLFPAALVTCALLAVSFALAAEKLEGPTIGIDLGTTYSCVATYQNGRVEILANEQGNRITPSVIAWTAEGERLVGDGAKNQAAMNPERTIFDVKRFIGRSFSDPTVVADKKLFPFELVSRDDAPFVRVKHGQETKLYAPEELSAMVLSTMRAVAERFIGQPTVNAVVTVPAYFNDAQRQATIDAGRIAGLNVIRTVNEPTAAAMAYGLNTKTDDTKILVFDLGGGTFDVSVLTLDSGVFEVLATSGDTHLGGEDFDQRVMAWVLKTIQQKHKVDLSSNKVAVARIRREAERAKRELSREHSVRLEVEGVLPEGGDFSETLTRAKFEELNRDLFDKCLGPVRQALKDAGVQKKEIDEVVLVGGSTRIPYVQEMLTKFFDGKKLNTQVNPDEAVAVGAAIQAAIIAGTATNELKDWLLLDVTPLTIGIELSGGEYMRFIERNSRLPVKRTRSITTEEDYQTSIPIRVFQGERPNVKDNVLLGEFDMDGIPPLKRGVAEVEVTFSMDANSILHVSAVDKATKTTGAITITADKHRLSEAQIKRMMKDAERNAEKDRLWRATVDARHKLEEYVYSVKALLEDGSRLATKLSREQLAGMDERVKAAIAFLDRHATRGEDSDAASVTAADFEREQAALEAHCGPLIAKLYGDGRDQRRGGDQTRGDHEDHDEL